MSRFSWFVVSVWLVVCLAAAFVASAPVLVAARSLSPVLVLVAFPFAVFVASVVFLSLWFGVPPVFFRALLRFSLRVSWLGLVWSPAGLPVLVVLLVRGRAFVLPVSGFFGR